ncbi:hypothetical protein [Butyrivibrio sp. WCD3002]|uniref:hypothetical protein n=1 Tax=Butyrivibrio sp. WCD3002 TaxID=1280676 RepID=UPI00040087D9|nr:hypothetical protein [Butyrivibrio sp. WCD3002]
MKLFKGRVPKGEFGYIEGASRAAIIRTAISVLACVVIFLIGLLIYHTNKSAFSIIAALGCIPAGLSAVNMIMYLRAHRCSKEAYEKIEAHRGGLLIRYELEMTSYEENYGISAATVLDKNVCCYSEVKGLDVIDCEKHIRNQIAQSGYSSYTVKVFKDLDAFCARLDQLEQIRASKNIDPQAIEDAWVPGTVETCAHVLLSISL